MRQPARTTTITLWGAFIAALALALTITAPAVAVDPGGREEALPATPPPTPSVPSVGTTVLSDGTPSASSWPAATAACCMSWTSVPAH